MTEDEFVQRYAAGSGLTIEELKKLNLVPAQCDCGERTCQGWQMKSR